MIEGDDTTERRVVQALSTGLDLGLIHIDMAELYGEGWVKKLVSQAIAGRREQVFLASKVLPANAPLKAFECLHRESLK